MTTFAEQLSTVRKSAGLTQEELAAAVHVARATISSWERGRTLPDTDHIELLSRTLHYDFINAAYMTDAAEAPAPAEAPAAPEAPVVQADAAAEPPDAEAQQEPAPQKVRRWLIPAVCAVFLAAVVCFLLFALPALRHAAAMPPVRASDLLLEEPALFTREWFRGGNPRYDGEPYITLTPSLSVNTLVQPFPLWEYMLVIDEVTGRDFRLDRVDDFFFYTDVGYNHTWTNGKTLWTAESGNAWKSEGCRAVSDAKGIGFLVYGYDAWGRKMSFRAYLDFTEAE